MVVFGSQGIGERERGYSGGEREKQGSEIACNSGEAASRNGRRRRRSVRSSKFLFAKGRIRETEKSMKCPKESRWRM